MCGVVIDANVLVSALWSAQGNPYKVVELVFMNEITPFFNDDVLEEYCEVLFRDKLSFSSDKVVGLLNHIMINGVFAEVIESSVAFTDEGP